MKHLGANLEVPALLLNLVHQRVAYLAIIHDARSRHANRSQTGDMRFHLFHFFRAETRRRHTVLEGTIVDRLELGEAPRAW